MKRFTLAALVLLAGLVAGARGQEPAQVLISAEQAGEQIPRLSSLYPSLDMAMAQGIQAAYVKKRLKQDRIAGYKAGLTTTQAQERFKVPCPVAGVLFASGRLKDRAVVKGSAFRLPMIETEIGFIMGKGATVPFEDAAAVREAVKEVVPVVELPDLGFAETKDLTGPDILAANVSARQFIAGEPQTLGGQDLNGARVTLTLEGSPVSQGQGADALGDQWQALLWLANTMIEQGYALAPGQILITGALGKMVPGKPGHYRADYGDLGRIEFQIR